MRKLLPGEIGIPTVVALARVDGKWVQDPARPTKAPRWRATVSIGTDAGKLHQIKREGDTKQAAKLAAQAAGKQWWDQQVAARVQAASEAASAAERAARGGTLRQLVEVYMSNPRNQRNGAPLRPNSLSNYMYGARLLCESELADLTADQIRPTMLMALYIKVAIADGHGSMAATNVRKVARAVLDGPVADHVIAVNPARIPLPGFPTNIPALVGPDRTPHVTGVDHKRDITDAEVAALLAGLYADPECGPMLSALDPEVRRSRTRNGEAGTGTANGKDIADVSAFTWLTGCRIGEALALRWSDLDLDAGTAMITGTTVYLRPVRDADGNLITRGRTVRQPEPKTQASRRTQDLTPGLVQILRRRAEVFGVDLDDAPETPVFGSPQKPTEYRERHNFSKVVKEMYTRHGMPFARTHAGRHYQITAMHRDGVSAVEIGTAVGQGNVSTTLAYINRATETSAAVMASRRRRDFQPASG